jgi:hypothetical protein
LLLLHFNFNQNTLYDPAASLRSGTGPRRLLTASDRMRTTAWSVARAIARISVWAQHHSDRGAAGQVWSVVWPDRHKGKREESVNGSLTSSPATLLLAQAVGEYGGARNDHDANTNDNRQSVCCVHD